MTFDYSLYERLVQQLAELGEVRRNCDTHQGKRNAQNDIVRLLAEMQQWVSRQPVEKGLTRMQRLRKNTVDSGETQA